MQKTPKQLAEERLNEAYEIAKVGERLSEIWAAKKVEYKRLLFECKSIAEADRQWEISDLGTEEKTLKLMITVKEHKMSSINSLLRVMDGEARNQY